VKERFDLVVVEGDLEVAVASRLLGDAGHRVFPGLFVNKHGQAAFWSDAPRYNRAAQRLRILGLVDLERAACASGLIRQKIGPEKHPNFVLRVAVRMIESWLIADSGLADEFELPPSKLPRHPDQEPHAKKLLVNLVRGYSPAKIQAGFVPERLQRGLTGYDYEPRLARFVGKQWAPREAAKRSPSLRRALHAIDAVMAA
jgi:hypothetical protein